jgi:hypothetical protein
VGDGNGQGIYPGTGGEIVRIPEKREGESGAERRSGKPASDKLEAVLFSHIWHQTETRRCGHCTAIYSGNVSLSCLFQTVLFI